MGGGEDHRDDTTWVVLELTHAGEQQIDEGTLDVWLRRTLGLPATHPIFIPSVTYPVGGQNVTVHLMEGYAFVASGLTESAYFRLENTGHVRKVLSARGPSGMRTLSVLPDTEICNLRLQLQTQVSSDVVLGMRIRVTEGPLTNIEGDVIEVDGDHAHIHVVMRTLNLIARVPRLFLTPISEDE